MNNLHFIKKLVWASLCAPLVLSLASELKEEKENNMLVISDQSLIQECGKRIVNMSEKKDIATFSLKLKKNRS